MSRALSLHRVALCAGAWLASAPIATPSHAQMARLTWQAAFSTAGADRRDVYFSARYFEPDSGWHALEAWRHGTQHLRRRTDGNLELYASARASGSSDYDFRLFDHRRHVVFKVDQAHLYRVGIFLDWFGLAHVLDRSKQAGSLQRTPARPDETDERCQWIGMLRREAQATIRTRVCWSAHWGLPFRIREQKARDVWEDRFVLDAVRDASAAEVWSVPAAPEGYTVFDADHDIAPADGD